MENLYLAKSKPRQTIQEHTDDAMYQYSMLKEKYPDIITESEWDILKIAVLYHDLGKMNTKFQNKIYSNMDLNSQLNDRHKNDKEIPHGYLSPSFLNIDELKKKYNYTYECLQVLVSAIFYHHDRNIAFTDTAFFDDIVKTELTEYKDNFNYSKLKIPDALSKRYKRYIHRDRFKSNVFEKYVKIKGLLNKVDYTASASSGNDGVLIEEDLKDEEGFGIDNRVLNMLNKWGLRDVQQYMKDNSDKNLIVTASTGIGKTEAALLWIGNNKGFYTLPLKVSINAIHERIISNKEENHLDYKKAVLLHSDAYNYYLESTLNESEAKLLYSKARLLSAPLTICTIDQLFRFVFLFRGFEHILSTLMYSKIVIDEIQMYSPDITAYILIGLKYVYKYGGRFAIITATLPKIFINFLRDTLKIEFTIPKKPFLSESIRHKVKLIESDINILEIEIHAKTKKVLVIVNTVKKAQEVFDKLNIENVWLLHSNYIKNHRKTLEKDILSFSYNKTTPETGVWISTQIVEASLDIDFDILITEMCTIDSLFQRMGRVFRHRILKDNSINVFIYINRNGVNKIIDIDLYNYSINALKDYNNKIITETDKQEIINLVYDPEKNPSILSSSYYQQIKNKLEKIDNIEPFYFSKAEVNKLFRNILSITIIPERIYSELEKSKQLDEWLKILNDSNSLAEEIYKVKNEIDGYTMNISHYESLPREGELYKSSSIYICRCPYEFDEITHRGKGLIRINSNKFYKGTTENL
jgi:CRISPR-associated endonuclease/helicase Cas3